MATGANVNFKDRLIGRIDHANQQTDPNGSMDRTDLKAALAANWPDLDAEAIADLVEGILGAAVNHRHTLSFCSDFIGQFLLTRRGAGIIFPGEGHKPAAPIPADNPEHLPRLIGASFRCLGDYAKIGELCAALLPVFGWEE